MHTHFIDMKHAIEPKSSFHRREIKLSGQKITLTERFHVCGQKDTNELIVGQWRKIFEFCKKGMKVR